MRDRLTEVSVLSRIQVKGAPELEVVTGSKFSMGPYGGIIDFHFLLDGLAGESVLVAGKVKMRCPLS